MDQPALASRHRYIFVFACSVAWRGSLWLSIACSQGYSDIFSQPRQSAVNMKQSANTCHTRSGGLLHIKHNERRTYLPLPLDLDPKPASLAAQLDAAEKGHEYHVSWSPSAHRCKARIWSKSLEHHSWFKRFNIVLGSPLAYGEHLYQICMPPRLSFVFAGFDIAERRHGAETNATCMYMLTSGPTEVPQVRYSCQAMVPAAE